MFLLEKAKKIIAPDPETLWERGGAEMRSVEIDAGRYEEVPFFDLEIKHRGKQHRRPMEDDSGIVFGEKITRTYITTDGIDRATRIFKPENASNDFVVSMTTPLGVSIDGIENDNAETIARELGVAVALIGAEHSARKYPFPLEVSRLYDTAKQSVTISLAKTAQSGQLILSDMCQEYDLSKVIVKTGESRSAMELDAEYPYATFYGLLIGYQDKTAMCLPDQLFSEDSEDGSLLQFPGSELIGVGYVTTEAFKERALRRFLGTISMNPNFAISNVIGIMPALASGESGVAVRWLPTDAAGHQVTYRNDCASYPNRQRVLYSGHPNISIITLGGTHSTLANPSTSRHQIARIGKFARELDLCNGYIDKINWNNVHLKDDDIYEGTPEGQIAA